MNRPFLNSHRRGYTLVEMVLAMASASVLTVGLGAAVLVTSRAFRPESTAQHVRTTACLAEADLLADLRLATGFTERTDRAITFNVPDRDGNGTAERLRYAWSGVGGDPLTLSYNGAAPFTVVADVRAFSLGYLTRTVAGVDLPAEQTGSPVLLLVNDSNNPTAFELARKALIESWNFSVTMLGLNDGEAILSQAELAQAVYISGTVEASKFIYAEKLSSTTTGIVNEHPDLVVELGFAAASNLVPLATSVKVVENTHYITTGFAAGNVTIANLSAAQCTLSSKPAAGINSLATISSTPALVTIDPKDPLSDGRPAEGRRVMLPWGGNSRDPSTWNANAQMLTCRAIEWATGLGEESLERKNFGYETVFGSTNGTANIQYATRAPLADNARVRSITAYVGGANDQVRLAIYSDKNGQPDKLLVQSEIGMTSTTMEWLTLDVLPTELAPGDYWLTFSFKNANQKYRYINSMAGAGERNKSNAAVTNGFLSTWGTSSASYSGARSIYATYEVLP